MKKLLVTTGQDKPKTETTGELVPEKMKGWEIETQPYYVLNETASAPDVALVQLDDATRPGELRDMISSLADMQSKGPETSYVLFSYRKSAKSKARKALASKRHFDAVLTQINHELPSFPNPDRVGVTFAQNADEMATELDHIGAKLDLTRRSAATHASAPRPSPLDRVVEIVKVSEDLRAPGGNLSASAVAAAFGVSLNQLAGWLGRTRQSVNKTPDADSLQDELGFFERAARLRAVLTKEQFLKWLRMPNAGLDDKKPLELLAGGERQVVADLVDDMLAGAPA